MIAKLKRKQRRQIASVRDLPSLSPRIRRWLQCYYSCPLPSSDLLEKWVHYESQEHRCKLVSKWNIVRFWNINGTFLESHAGDPVHKLICPISTCTCQSIIIVPAERRTCPRVRYLTQWIRKNRSNLRIPTTKYLIYNMNCIIDFCFQIETFIDCTRQGDTERIPMIYSTTLPRSCREIEAKSLWITYGL